MLSQVPTVCAGKVHQNQYMQWSATLIALAMLKYGNIGVMVTYPEEQVLEKDDVVPT